MVGEVVGEVGGVNPEPVEERRLAPPEERQAQHVQTWCVGDAASMTYVSRPVGDRDVQADGLRIGPTDTAYRGT